MAGRVEIGASKKPAAGPAKGKGKVPTRSKSDNIKLVVAVAALAVGVGGILYSAGIINLGGGGGAPPAVTAEEQQAHEQRVQELEKQVERGEVQVGGS